MTMRRAIAAMIVLILATAGLMLFGLEPLFALSGGVLAATVVLLLVLRTSEAVVEDGPQADPDPARRGSEISRLAWTFNPRTGVVGEIVIRRVRAILRRRLVRRGVDVDDPLMRGRVDALLGAGLWERLSARQVQAADIRRALEAADRLVDASDTDDDGRTTDRPD